MLKNFEYPNEVYNLRNPTEVIPKVREYIDFNSVLDVGCGIGVWLNVIEEKFNIQDYLGIDGDYVLEKDLKIDKNKFQSLDLSQEINLKRKFDLAICLEVAEHLPIDSAKILIKNICKHSDTVLFSAAIPKQGGSGHINEQWPSYWQEIFKSFNYDFYDTIRPEIWHNSSINYVYRQNIFIVANKESEIAQKYQPTSFIDFVHPEMYLYHVKQSLRCNLIEQGKAGWKIPIRAFLRTVKNKLSGKK